MEACEQCGFEWDAVGVEAMPGRLRAVAAGYRDALTGHPAPNARFAPDTWSSIEYAAHARDAVLNLRDRIMVGLAEDNPITKPMYTQVRINSGVYATESLDDLIAGIDVAAGLLARAVSAVSSEHLQRPIFYPWPVVTTRTLLWVAAQALHEAEHHLGDVRDLAEAHVAG